MQKQSSILTFATPRVTVRLAWTTFSSKHILKLPVNGAIDTWARGGLTPVAYTQDPQGPVVPQDIRELSPQIFQLVRAREWLSDLA